MKALNRKCVLLGILSLVVCFILYTKCRKLVLNSDQSDVESPVKDELDWKILSAGEQDEEVEAPCSLREAVRNDVLLKDKFNFAVSVLQSASSFSKPAWDQLKSRSPPYGWKGLPVTVVGGALSLLPSSRLFPRGSPGRCVRCAVVGNGGILRGSRQGRNIDGHDFVFRMNGAVIRGFEDDVGTKISFYGFTTNTLKHALSWYRADGFSRTPQSPDIKYVFIPSDLRDYVMLEAAVQGRTVSSGRDKGDRPWRYFGHKPPENFKFLHPGFISYVTRSFLSSRLLTNMRTRHLYMPSTGALLLLAAIHTCDQVSAYGFITRDYAAFSDHYYDSAVRPLRFFANHDLLMEGQLWETLHRGGVIRLYQRTGAD